jgi:two-component sensor histidine kinase/HAMP domain-containing protein
VKKPSPLLWNRIGTKFFLVSSLLVGLMCLFIFLYFPPQQERILVRALRSRGHSIAAMMAYNLSAAITFDDAETIAEVVRSARQNPDLVYAVVMDHNGRELLAEGRPRADRAVFLEATPENPVSRDGFVFRVAEGVAFRGREIGRVHLGFSLEDLKLEARRIRVFAGVVSASVFLLGMALLYGLSALVTRPLRHMAETVRRISAGDLTERASASSRDEVGQLAASFNGMVDKLAGAQRELEAANQSLEKRVEERTRSLQASVREKEILIQEIHHRVKNNMQIISSLVNLQAGRIKDAETKGMFMVTKDRIRSMALVHEKIYRSKDFARIDFVDYVRNLVAQIFRSYGVSGNAIRAEVEGDPVFLNISTAVPCSLIVNELVSNSLKHAFPDGRTGRLVVRVSAVDDGRFGLVFSDDGVGLPAGFDMVRAESLGLQIVSLLVEQLDGTLEVDGRQGTRFSFKLHEAREKSVPSPAAD